MYRREELVKIKIDDKEFKEHLWVVHIPDSKMKQSRMYTLINSTTENANDYVEYCKIYIDLR